ncbi:hypothetical protein PMAYCL1PPCAC_17442, partial [Pristionchus mayeri]
EMSPPSCDGPTPLSIVDLCPSLEKCHEMESVWESPVDRPAPIRGMYRQSSNQGEPRQFAKRHSSVEVVKEWFRRRSSSVKYDAESGRKMTWVEAYTGRIAKPAHAYLRWNLVFTFIILVMLTSAFWLPFIPVVGSASLEICLAVLVILHLLWLAGMINAMSYTYRLIAHKKRRAQRDVKVPINDHLKHLVGICLYKEPIQLMVDTVESIAVQPRASEKISVVVGMEAGTPDRIEKELELQRVFGKRFERFMVTTHPKGLPGDIAGKCSNINYAMRTAVKMLREDKKYPQFEKGDATQLLITTGDCDSIFGEGYFEALEEDFTKTPEEKRDHTVWQSPLFYAINLHNSPFFVRVTGLLRAFFMMGYLIPWNINTMSIFSLTLELYEAGGYTHPGYQMEDIIALIRWSLAVRRQCTIKCIPVATLSGPTSGHSYVNEWYEWARQIRRWTIGAAEVFHYFAVKARSLPFFSALGFSAKFIFYYGFLLCIGQIYGILAPIVTPLMMPLSVNGSSDGLLVSAQLFTWITLGFLGLSYLEMAAVFIVNRVAEQTFPGGRRDDTPHWRSFFHWIGSVPTILMYCLVELFAFLEVTVRGKSVCSHSASKKDQLVALPPSQNKVYPI